MGEIVNISGRQKELKILGDLLEKQEGQFLAVYGRRRVGKTHLIREFFKDKGRYFEVIGLKDGSLANQLGLFKEAFQATFYPEIPIAIPKNWHEALTLLTKEIEKEPSKKTIIFFDELPWLASRRSGFIQQLDHFWNSRWSKWKNVVLVVCGSAASWMLEKLIYAKGGLHNRLTQTIHLLPFTLQETKNYLENRGIRLNHEQVLEIYMVMGGVPYYLNALRKGYSAAQNINETCFTSDGLLFLEFDRLFASLFGEEEVYLRLIAEIGNHRYGIGRERLLKKVKIKTGGRSHKRLRELEQAGFIASFTPYGKQTEIYYRLIDEYTCFYLHWLKKRPKGILSAATKNYWLKKMTSPAWNSWAGYVFEGICLKHAAQIAEAMGLESIPFEVGNWRTVPRLDQNIRGAQIDLLFDRDDGVIALCEIKFSRKEFIIDRKQALVLEERRDIFQKHLKTKKQLLWTLISPHGVKKSAWAEEILSSQVTLDQLF
jgi:uncharacterized protein